MSLTKRNRIPTSRDTAEILSILQDQIGRARGLHHDDRNQKAHAQIDRLLEHSFDLCVDARSFLPPERGEAPWHDPCTDWEHRI